MVNRYSIVLLVFISVIVTSQIASAQDHIYVEFFFSEGCPDCEASKPIIAEIENSYRDQLIVERVDISLSAENWDRWDVYNFTFVPAVVINNETKIPNNGITKEKLENIILMYLLNLQDNDSVYTDKSPKLGIQGANYTVAIVVTENITIQQVFLSWSHGNLSGTNITLSNDDNLSWSHIITLDESPENLTYTITLVFSENMTYSGQPQSIAVEEAENPYIIQTPWGDLDTSEYALSVNTIIIAAMDSFNPCAFFVLLFLLSLLTYVKSRKRMFLIGGIFIFFSGFIYFLFMLALLGIYEGIFLITQQQTLLTIGAGVIALVLGLLNIKDFFFFKKGMSISIPDDKKPKLIEKMRAIVKARYLSSMIAGTIVLAIFANSYELFCTLILPTSYIVILKDHTLIIEEQILWLVYYNIVYVIPLIIIVTLITLKLSKQKLTDWQGRMLKLFSGTMMFLLGLILLVDPKFFTNLLTTLVLLCITIAVTFTVSSLMKKYARNHSQD